jgi:hypothetical protein
MQRVIVVVLTIAGLSVTGVPRVAAESNPAPGGSTEAAQGTDDGRYSFYRAGEGFLRLDTRNGQVAQCGWSGPGWSCKLVPDERAALESEIGRLQRDNAELKRSLLSRGIELPPGMVAQAPAAGPVPPADVSDPSAKAPAEPKMPSDAELDRAVAFMKHVWRRLVDMMSDLQRDMEKKS